MPADKRMTDKGLGIIVSGSGAVKFHIDDLTFS